MFLVLRLGLGFAIGCCGGCDFDVVPCTVGGDS